MNYGVVKYFLNIHTKDFQNNEYEYVYGMSYLFVA